jgi:hypothetical protein
MAVAFAAAVTGCGSSSGGATTHAAKFAEARFPGYRIAFRYPSDWKRRHWCWVTESESPLILLTTGRRPKCTPGNLFGFATPLPPPMGLGPNGVVTWWTSFSRPKPTGAPNARIAGKPARIVVNEEPTKPKPTTSPNCGGSGPKQRRLTAQIPGPGSGVGTIQVGAVICGPNFGAGEADVRQMLNSLRFTS